MIYVALAFLVPVVAAIHAGTTYTFAWKVSAVGVVLYIANVILSAVFIRRRAGGGRRAGGAEQIPGTGFVPRWVLLIGRLGFGFALSGLVVAMLLRTGLVRHLGG